MHVCFKSMKMNRYQIKKQNTPTENDNLESLTKEELIYRIKSLQAHNAQLKNIIAKNQGVKPKKLSNKNKPFDFSKCYFRHVLLRFLYLGWDYKGYAIQEDTINTIEYHLFKALEKTCLIKDRSSSNYHRCGRTDKGVSSFGQVISINLRSKLSEECHNNLHEEIDYCKILNRVLPENIQCVAWCPVDGNFSARFDCKNRTYKYFFPKGNLNLQKMNEGAEYLVGTHDFRNFCKMDVGNGVVEFIRNIKSVNVELCTNDPSEYTMCVVTIKGRSFLWHQIRCIMGILFLIGQNKEQPELVKELLNVEKNTRKPDYNMASEVPLNLYSCEYENIDEWYYDFDALNTTVQKLKELWTFNSVKTTMTKHMTLDLESVLRESDYFKSNQSQVNKCTSECLIQGIKTKKYVPVMKRPKCGSLEDKIQHFVKRCKLEKKSNEDNHNVIGETDQK